MALETGDPAAGAGGALLAAIWLLLAVADRSRARNLSAGTGQLLRGPVENLGAEYRRLQGEPVYRVGGVVAG
jgi:hypothetical protein